MGEGVRGDGARRERVQGCEVLGGSSACVVGRRRSCPRSKRRTLKAPCVTRLGSTMVMSPSQGCVKSVSHLVGITSASSHCACRHLCARGVGCVRLHCRCARVRGCACMYACPCARGRQWLGCTHGCVRCSMHQAVRNQTVAAPSPPPVPQLQLKEVGPLPGQLAR